MPYTFFQGLDLVAYPHNQGETTFGCVCPSCLGNREDLLFPCPTPLGGTRDVL